MDTSKSRQGVNYRKNIQGHFRSLYLSLIFLLISIFQISAQNVHIYHNIKDKEFDFSHGVIYYQSQPDSSNVPPASTVHSSTCASIVHDLLFGHPATDAFTIKLGCNLKANFRLNIFNCHFLEGKIPDYTSEDCDNRIPVAEFSRDIFIDSCWFANELGISNIISKTYAGTLKINYDTASYLDLRYAKVRLATLSQNVFKNSVNLSFNHIDLAVIASINPTNKQAYFNSSNSNYKVGVELLNNDIEDSGFYGDTISGYLHYVSNLAPLLKRKDSHRNLEFNGCYINSTLDIKISDSLFHSKVTFYNCSFGNLATIFNINADTVEFKDCTNIPYPLFLTADPAKKMIFLQLINSNVNNIRFDYTDNFKLFFDSNISEETKNNTYQSLLAKYKSEGKPQNIEKIDIEYKRHEYRQHVLTYPIWLLDYIWWRYGYSKWLVILWCILFVMLFFTYNYARWEQMQKVYDIFGGKKGKTKEQNLQSIERSLMIVFIYTSFIFFSLRVDFEKLKYSDRKFLAAFFVQYLVGLICLFFLANAIFKIGNG